MPRTAKNLDYNASSETIQKWSGIVEEHEEQQAEDRQEFNQRWETGQKEEGVDRGMCTQVTKLKRTWEKKGAVAAMRQRFVFYLDCIVPDDQADMFASLGSLEYEARNLGLHEAVDQAVVDLKAAIAKQKSEAKPSAKAKPDGDEDGDESGEGGEEDGDQPRLRRVG